MSKGMVIVLVFALALMANFALSSAVADDCKNTYENFGTDFMAKYCLNCHNSAKSGLSRKFAPKGMDFDKVESIKKEKAVIITEVYTEKKMPPFGTKPSDEQRAQVKSWLECEYK